MESYFDITLNENKETDNLLYNIVNSQDPKQIFLYGLVIIIITFISTKIIYDSNILIGLVFSSLIIYYLYTYRKFRIITNEQKFNEKFDILYTKNNILYKYPKIVDYLYYLQNFKYDNIQGYNEIINLFEIFCTIYEFCIIDINLISENYQKLIDYKITILNMINNFIFIYENVEYDIVLFKHKQAAEKIINQLLNNLIILYKKKLYYDGYNNGTINIDYSKVLPYNILNENDYKSNIQYNPSNLIFF
jgi:hypothetical protein